MDLTVIIVIALISIVVFLALRELMTWYLKIDVLIKNQDTQIAYQKAILEELKKKNHPVGSEVSL